MRILIEEYPYKYDAVSNVLRGIVETHDADHNVSLSRVGYFYSPEVSDCVFILPKVIIEGEKGHERAFGHIDPYSLIDADKCEELRPDERKFIYELSVWIYRAIKVFKDQEFRRKENKKGTSIVEERRAPMMGHSRRRKSNTFLDVLLALQQWNRDNEQFVMFVVKNMHAGQNKINWTRTIAKSPAIVQTNSLGPNRQEVIYLNPINKKRQVNFDEELLIIYYSILYYINDQYGFPVRLNVNFPLITGKRFERYLNNYGRYRLKQIKYKYYSDKALELWELCYAFFDRPYQINLNVDYKEYLLVKDFQIVFEAIIDELLAGDQELPKELLDQPDGKRVDHMFQYHELTNNERQDNIYYIGDSKYYKRQTSLDDKAVYKQYTYSRNVIQWNIDLFNNGTPEQQKGHHMLRHDVTEGYNVIPNFFISANQNTLKAIDDIDLIDNKLEPSKRRKQYYLTRQYLNRLFDRDTLMLAHYDVNFLYVLSLYARNNAGAKVAWRTKVRKLFRQQIQEMLKMNFIFYAATAHADVEPETYIRQNFQTLLGKVFHPFGDREGSDQKYYSLALRKPELEQRAEDRLAVQDENESVLFQLRQAFYVELCPLGDNPVELLPKVEPLPHREIASNLLTMHYLENYPDVSFVIGGFNREKQLRWMFSREGGKRDDAYNVRMGKNVPGGVVKSRDYIKSAKFVILYEFGKEQEGVYKAFRVKNTGEMTREKMIRTGYSNPQHDAYFCYFFDEEVTLGQFDIPAILAADRQLYRQQSEADKKLDKNYPTGRPVYMTGRELMGYRR